MTLRENVTRRIHSPRYRCATLGSPGRSLLASPAAAAVQSTQLRSATSRSCSATRPSADEAGVYLATARGYDDGRGRRRSRSPATATPTSASSTAPPARLHRGDGGRAAGEARALRRRDHPAGRAPEGARGRARPDARLHAGAAGARRGGRRDGRPGARSRPRPAVNRAGRGRLDLDGGRAVLRRARSRGPGRDPTVAADAHGKWLLRADARGTPGARIPGGPTSGSISTRPSRTSRRTSSPAMPASSSSFSVPWTTSAPPRRGRTGGRR